jgi:hypothetical protein
MDSPGAGCCEARLTICHRFKSFGEAKMELFDYLQVFYPAAPAIRRSARSVFAVGSGYVPATSMRLSPVAQSIDGSEQDRD